ncbi:hypothetical protein M405DRAFT_819327, partial [Rhizopogon salebrosus TDB-379]
ILTLIVTFSTTLTTTSDTYLPNRVNSLLSFVATIEDPIHPSNRMETRVRVDTILNGYVSRSAGGAHVSHKASTTSKKTAGGTTRRRF